MATESRPGKRLPLPLWLQFRIWIGRRFYGGARGRGQVFFLPRNRVAKLACFPTEAAAAAYVRQHTTIPVPKIYQVYAAGNGDQHIVMEKLPGTWAVDTVATWTQEQKDVFSRDLADCIRQLRALQPPSPQYIGSVGAPAKGHLYDDRLSVNPCGPFDNIADFHTYIRFGRPLEHWTDRPDVMKVHSKPEAYTSKFTHCDLCPKNILVAPDGHITGIVDWEYAGWYPEYWEYTKVYHFENHAPNWKNYYDAVDEQPAIQKYRQELACERAIWARMGDAERYFGPQWQPGDGEKAYAHRLQMEARWEEQRKKKAEEEHAQARPAADA